jgi:hypothetical protein
VSWSKEPPTIPGWYWYVYDHQFKGVVKPAILQSQDAEHARMLHRTHKGQMWWGARIEEPAWPAISQPSTGSAGHEVDQSDPEC